MPPSFDAFVNAGSDPSSCAPTRPLRLCRDGNIYYLRICSTRSRFADDVVQKRGNHPGKRGGVWSDLRGVSQLCSVDPDDLSRHEGGSV